MRKPLLAVVALIVFANAAVVYTQLPGSTGRTTIGSLVACSAIYQGRIVVIKDGQDESDCSVGGAMPGVNSHAVECMCDVDGVGGYAWRSHGVAGSGGPPSGAAGGDLAGTYPSPTIAPNAVALGTDTTGGYAASSTEAGPATTAIALAANGSNCSAGSFPLGVDASGASETCTALPTTITGTVNQIAASGSTGAITLSIPSSPTLPGTTTGTFSGPLTGNASTATALAANGSNCSAGQAAAGVSASGAAEDCAAYLPTGTAALVNADVSTSAAIALSKLAASTASRCARFDSDGVLAPASADCASGDTGISGLGATDNSVVRSDGVGGSAAQGSSVRIEDNGDIKTPGDFYVEKTEGSGDKVVWIRQATGNISGKADACFGLTGNVNNAAEGMDVLLCRASAGVWVVTSTVKLQDPGTRPTCDSTARGTLWMDQGGTGVADTLAVCAKDGADAYAWHDLY